MRHLRALLAVTILAPVAAAVFSACGYNGNQNNASIGHRPGGGGGGNGPGASEEKALPELGSNDLKFRALEELMRTFRTAGFLEAMPAKPDATVGCLSFKHYQTGPALKIFYNCAWSQTLGGEALLIGLKSQETFSYAATPNASSSAIAELSLTASRPAVAGANPVEIFKSNYHRITSLAPTAATGDRDLNSSMLIGAVGDTTTDYWASATKGKLVTSTAPMQIALSTLDFTYRPADSTAKHTYTRTLHFVPKTITTFDGSTACRRPIGTFDWSIIVGSDVTEMGTITVDQTGLTETSVTPNVKLAWPSSCLEFAPARQLEN